ncbi:MAG: DUF1521 domain-containing protein [Candidatus Competibacteraceae bacterium]|nr:DUF1521 domain-containing protein [Candidatus Competibacteraceae bacterium]
MSEAADELDELADQLRGQQDSGAFDEVEAAIDQLKAALDKLSEDPSDSEAMMDAKYAAIELKRTVAGLEGQIPDDAFEALQNAVAEFEDVTDAFVRAPYRTDGADILKEALPEVLDKLEGVTEALQQLSDDSTSSSSTQRSSTSAPDSTTSGAAQSMLEAVEELDDLCDQLKGELSGAEFRAVEHAIDELRAAAEQLAQNPDDPEAGQAFEAAAQQLKEAVEGLEDVADSGYLNDNGMYKALQHAADEFEKAADALNIGSEQSPDELADKMDAVTEALSEVTDNLENLGPSRGSTTSNASNSSWQVDQENNTIQLDNGYELSFDNERQSWHIKDADGNEVNIWGDPHVKENDGGKWDFKQDSTFVLDDGTKITVHTSPTGNGQTVTDTVTITKGDQAIQVTGIANNNVQISEVMSNGEELDAAHNDGYVFYEENGVDDWTNENGDTITANQAMGNAIQNEVEVVER